MKEQTILELIGLFGFGVIFINVWIGLIITFIAIWLWIQTQLEGGK